MEQQIAERSRTEEKCSAMEIVHKLITERLAERRIKLPALALSAGIPHSTLHRAYQKESPLKHHYFRMLLNESTKSEVKTISIMYEIPYYKNYAERQRKYIKFADQVNDPIEKALVRSSTFKVAFMASYGTTRAEIVAEYGNEGLVALSKIIESKIVTDWTLDKNEVAKFGDNLKVYV